MVKRCLAVEICAVKGESSDQELTNAPARHYGAAAFFSTGEKIFINNAKPSKQELVNFAWQYERVHVLLWALGYVNKLKDANQTCDAESDSRVLQGKSARALTANAKPRTMKEIMDQADLYYRLHWTATELRLRAKHSDKVNEEVIDERHHALNWLIRYQRQDWDDLTSDT